MDAPVKIRWLVLTLVALAPASSLLAGPADDQFAVGAAHYNQGRWSLASQEFQQFLSEFAGDARAEKVRFYLAESLVQLGRFEEASQHFQTFLKAVDDDHPLATKALFRAAESEYLAGHLETASALLGRFRTTHAEHELNGYVLAYLADVELRRGELTAAEATYRQSLKTFPQGPMAADSRFGLAATLDRLGRHDEAATEFSLLAADRDGPLAELATLRWGALLLSRRDFDEAANVLKPFDTRWKQGRWFAGAQLLLGQVDYFRGNQEAALARFQALTGDTSLAVESNYWIAMSHRAADDWPNAIAALEQARQHADQHHLAAEIEFQLGDALRRAGRLDEAQQRLQAVLERWPDSAWADDALLGRIRALVKADDHGDVDQLVKDFERRFPASEHAADVHTLHARSLVAREMFDRAAEVLAAAQPAQAPAADEVGQSGKAPLGPLGNPVDSLAGERAPSDHRRLLLATARQGLNEHEAALAVLAPLIGDPQHAAYAEAQRLRGVSLLALSRYELAAEAFTAALAGKLAEHVTQTTRAQLLACHVKLGQFDAAGQVWHALTASEQADAAIDMATLLAAEAALAAERFDDARRWYDYLKSHAATAEMQARGQAGLGWVAHAAGDWALAARTFQQYLEQHADAPQAADTALARAAALEKLAEHDAAILAYQRVAESWAEAPQAVLAQLNQARLHRRLGQSDEAVTCYQKALADHGPFEQRAAALYELAWLLRELDRHAEAQQPFDELRREHASSRYWADAVYRLAETAFEQKNFDQCRQRLEELITGGEAPEILPHALYLRAQVAIAQGEWDQVTEPLEQLLASFSDSQLVPLADYWIAEAAFRQARYDDAGKRLAELEPRLTGRDDAWLGMVPLRRAQVLAHKKQWAEALEIAQSVAQRFPDFQQQYEVDYLVGRCLASLAQFEEARAAYRRAIDSQWGGKTETAAMAQWMIGESYFHQKNHAAAIREYLRLEILYDYPTWQAAALLQAGKCHEQLGEWPQAIELYARIINKYPDTQFTDEAARRLPQARQRGGTSG